MHTGRTCTYHHTIQIIFFNCILYECLPRIRTHIFIINSVCHAFHIRSQLSNFYTINSSTDIFSAMAYKDTYS